MQNKLQLIQMIDDDLGPYRFAERTAPPLGLLSIATYVQERHDGWSVEILDNAVIDAEAIHSRIGADVVGFSVNLWNYPNTLKAAKIAKARGAQVVIGGHHATSVAASILRNREYIDAVIVGDGEEAMSCFLGRRPFSHIPNAVYREAGGIRANERRNVPMCDLPIPSRELVDLKPYVANFRKALPQSPFQTYTTFYTHKGCTFRLKNGPCIFCGIAIDGYRARQPEQAWAELEYLSHRHGITYVMDVGDNLVKPWVTRLARDKPQGLKVSYTGYLRPSEVDEECADALAQSGCHSIFLGIESGDDGILQKARKGATSADNLRAVTLLSQVGISVRLGVVLGLPGESRRSILRTLSHIDTILAMGRVEGIYTSIMVPLPGSPSFELLCDFNGIGPTLRRQDLFSLDHLRRYWASSFTAMTYDDLLEAESKIQAMATPICQ